MKKTKWHDKWKMPWRDYKLVRKIRQTILKFNVKLNIKSNYRFKHFEIIKYIQCSTTNKASYSARNLMVKGVISLLITLANKLCNCVYIYYKLLY